MNPDPLTNIFMHISAIMLIMAIPSILAAMLGINVRIVDSPRDVANQAGGGCVGVIAVVLIIAFLVAMK